METFSGFVREDGTVGTRNLVGIIPAVFCSNDVVNRISRDVQNAVPIAHSSGCGRLPFDNELATEVLINLGRNPNLGAVLVVYLGCEGVDADKVVEGISASGKPVKRIDIQESGGTVNSVRMGVSIAKSLSESISELRREEVGVDELILALRCGSSDSTSGLASNPVTGVVTDKLVKAGGSAILSEVTEFFGADEILKRRASSEDVRDAISGLIRNKEEEILGYGADIRGGNPSPGNIRGGLTTIEEKALGGITKGGRSKIKGVINFSERLQGQEHGLYLLDAAAQTTLTGAMAAGAQIALFTTGKGSPAGTPLMPVIKVTGNPSTYDRMKDDLDFNAGTVIQGKETISDAGDRLWDLFLKVASDRKTKSEILGYTHNVQISTRGPEI